jgi:hypothetical protein
MLDRANAQRAERSARTWVCAIAALTVAWAGCAGLTAVRPTHNIDRVSRSSEAFFAFLQSPGETLDEIRKRMPSDGIDSVYLIDQNVTNKELGEYIQGEASGYPFEVFLRITVSTENQHVYRYIVKGDWRSVKMGYGSLQHPEFYDAIYLHTHPRGKRIIPNSIQDYLHAEAFGIVSTLLIGDGIPIEFEIIEGSRDGVDQFEVDGRSFSLKRADRPRLRSKEQLRRNRHDADDAVRELDRIFRENVEIGHERVALRNSEGMLVTYERNRAVHRRLDEVYSNAGLLLPAGGDKPAPPDGITLTTSPETTRPLGY